MTGAGTSSDQTRLIASLGLPKDGPGAEYFEVDGAATAPVLAALVNEEVAASIWRRWYPALDSRLQNDDFRNALQGMLSAGVAMGYSVDRFESASRDLSDPRADANAWLQAFEHAVAARNAVGLSLHVHPELRDAFDATNAKTVEDGERWNKMVAMMIEGLFYELGIIVPRLDLVADDELSPMEACIVVNDARLPRRWLLSADQALVNDTVDRLTLLNIKGEDAVNPANGSECAIINIADVEVCKQAGLTTWDRAGCAVLTVASTARGMAGGFVNQWLTECFCSRLAKTYPEVVAGVRRALPLEMITHVLRALIDEEISIRNLLRVFEVLAIPEVGISADFARHIVFAPNASARSQWYRQAAGLTPVRDRHLSRVRSAMARYISHKYTRGGNTLVVYLLDPKIEERLADPMPMHPGEKRNLLTAIHSEVGNLSPNAVNPVVLTTTPVRLRLRREIAATFPHLAVVCYQELNPDMNIQPIARIALE